MENKSGKTKSAAKGKKDAPANKSKSKSSVKAESKASAKSKNSSKASKKTESAETKRRDSVASREGSLASVRKELKGKGLLIAAYLYVFLPSILFITFWLRSYIGIPVAALVIICCYDLIISEEPIWKPKGDKRNNRVKIAAILAILLMWVLSAGIGGSVIPYGDQAYRNRMFMMLINNPWPVRMAAFDGTRIMTYYIGYWLPAAFISKLTTLSNALLILQAWSVLGLYLSWRFICEKFKNFRIWYLIVFIFFGGLDRFGRWLTGDLYATPGNNYEWWSMFFVMPGFNTQLFWAYNHIISAVIIYCLIDRQKSNKGILLIWSNALLCCTFPAVGMIPFAACRAIENAKGKDIWHRFADAVKKSISLANIAGLLVALIFTIYLLPNVALTREAAGNYTKYNVPTLEVNEEQSGGEKADEDAGFSIIPKDRGSFTAHPWTSRLWIFFWAFMLEAGLFLFITYDYAKDKPMYWTCIGALLILPWIHVGAHNDFCMRATIPAFFCLYEIVVGAFEKYHVDKKRVYSLLLVVLLLGSSLTVFNTTQVKMARSARKIIPRNGHSRVLQTTLVNYNQIADSPNFGAREDTFFAKYMLAKHD